MMKIHGIEFVSNFIEVIRITISPITNLRRMYIPESSHNHWLDMAKLGNSSMWMVQYSHNGS